MSKLPLKKTISTSETLYSFTVILLYIYQQIWVVFFVQGVLLESIHNWKLVHEGVGNLDLWPRP